MDFKQIVVLSFVLFLAIRTSAAAVSPAKADLQKAEALFQQQHWAEARAAYDQAEKAGGTPGEIRRAAEGTVACYLKLSLRDDAMACAWRFVTGTKDPFERARGERFLAGLCETLRTDPRLQYGQWGQIIWSASPETAVKHYERAREILASLARKPATANAAKRQLLERERIGVDFDLAAALVGVGRSPGWWTYSPGQVDPAPPVEEPEEDQPALASGYSPGWGGIGVGPEGRLRFPQTPQRYSPQLEPGEKIRFLLAEAQRLDTSERKNSAARALLRKALLAHSFCDSSAGDISLPLKARYDRWGRLDRNGPRQKQPWELGEDEIITLAAGQMALVTLPPSESPAALLRQLEREYPRSSLRPEVSYSRALFFQARHQFSQALGEYRSLGWS